MGTSDLILDRLKQVLPCRDDTSLALRLGVAKSTLSNWRSRDSFPYTIAVQLAGELGLSLDWVLAGVGPPYRCQKEELAVAEQQAAYNVELTPRQQNLLTLFESLDEDGKREIQTVAQEKKRLKDLEQRIAELDRKISGGMP